MTNRKTFQNKTFPELNSKKHTPSPNRLSFTKLRKTWVSQKRKRAILRKMTFANDCTNCCFFAQNWCAKKEKFCVSFRKNCANVLRMETLMNQKPKIHKYGNSNNVRSTACIYNSASLVDISNYSDNKKTNREPCWRKPVITQSW